MPTIDGHAITITHPEKVLFPADGITKGELAEYYQQIAPRMIPHVRDRPLHMNRFPGGIQYNPIQQKRVPDSFPAWITRATLDLQRGGTITHAVIDNAEARVDEPSRLTRERTQQRPEGRLLGGVNRNACAQTAVAPYPVRAPAEARIAMPVTWPEVESDAPRPERVGIRNVSEWLRHHEE